MPAEIPVTLSNQKYILITTFRKTGVPVRTPVWFAEENGKLYIFTNPESGKVKRIGNNPDIKIAPCTIRGKITGPEFSGRARILPQTAAPGLRKLLERKYWLMRVPFLWSKNSIFIEIQLV
jgi:PPOX class probable F420-dependent enzyme